MEETTPIPFEEEFPEAGAVMAELMQTKKGRRQLQGIINEAHDIRPVMPQTTWVLNCPTEYQMLEHTPTVVRELPKIGRNDPCPCGSGKKFKKCCANKEKQSCE